MNKKLRTIAGCALLSLAAVAQAQTPVFDPTILTQQPAGTLHDLQARSTEVLADLYYEGKLSTMNDTYAYSKYVVASDGTVYLYRPSAIIKDNCWLKLDKLNGDTLVARLPQCVYNFQYDEENTFPTYLFPMKKAYMAEIESDGMVPDTLANGQLRTEVKFTFKDGVIKQIDDVYLSLCFEDFTPLLIGEKIKEIKPFTEQPVTLSESAKSKLIDFHFTGSDGDSIYNKILRGAIDGNDVYLQNPEKGLEKQWIKGTISGNKATFAKQYLDVDSTSLYHYLYFSPVVMNGENAVLGDNLTFDYNAASQSFTSQEDAIMAINAGADQLNFSDYYINPCFEKFNEVAATPATPIIDTLYVLHDDGRYGYFAFYINTTDVDGNFIRPDSLYYRIYVDNKLFTFKPSTYTFLKSDLTDIPFGFSDTMDILRMGGSKRQVNFYFSNYTNVGVQSVYRGGGQEKTSPVVWYRNPDTATAISNLHDNATQSIQYFDLSGRKLSRPSRGLIIQKIGTAGGRTIIGKKIIK